MTSVGRFSCWTLRCSLPPKELSEKLCTLTPPRTATEQNTACKPASKHRWNLEIGKTPGVSTRLRLRLRHVEQFAELYDIYMTYIWHIYDIYIYIWSMQNGTMEDKTNTSALTLCESPNHQSLSKFQTHLRSEAKDFPTEHMKSTSWRIRMGKDRKDERNLEMLWIPVPFNSRARRVLLRIWGMAKNYPGFTIRGRSRSQKPSPSLKQFKNDGLLPSKCAET